MSRGGNSGDVTVTANDVSNPIMQGYTAGQVIQTYTNDGYTAYQARGRTRRRTCSSTRTSAGVGTLPGVIETTTGGTNVHFATAGSARRQQSAVERHPERGVRHQPGVALHISRDAGIVAARMDMDQSQFPADVSPAAGGPGIYDKLIPILQQWKQQYNFVGSYYINIGDNPTPADAIRRRRTGRRACPTTSRSWRLGGEIGTHSYTHLINPPDHDVHGAHRRRHAGRLDADHPGPACRPSPASRSA